MNKTFSLGTYSLSRFRACSPIYSSSTGHYYCIPQKFSHAPCTVTQGDANVDGAWRSLRPAFDDNCSHGQVFKRFCTSSPTLLKQPILMFLTFWDEHEFLQTLVHSKLSHSTFEEHTFLDTLRMTVSKCFAS